MTRLSICALALLAACAPEPTDVTPDPDPDAAGAEAVDEATTETRRLEVDGTTMSLALEGEPVASALTTDGSMELGVTDRVVYARLSPGAQKETVAEVRRETGDGSGLGAQIGRAVAGALEAGLGVAAQVPLADVAAVRAEGGRLVIEMADGEPSPFESSGTTDDRPFLESFAPADAKRIAEAFDRVR